MIDEMLAVLLNKQVLFLAGAIVGILFFLGKIPVGATKKDRVKRLGQNKWYRRFLPVLPVLLGVGGAFCPGVAPPELAEQWGGLVVFGMWTGFAAAHGRKVFKRLIVDKLDDNE